jgi:hypothetical protein
VQSFTRETGYACVYRLIAGSERQNQDHSSNFQTFTQTISRISITTAAAAAGRSFSVVDEFGKRPRLRMDYSGNEG